jgi:uncharacterized membrane protein
MKPITQSRAVLLFLALLAATPASAHEAHRENMSDAEMAQMEAGMDTGSQIDGQIGGDNVITPAEAFQAQIAENRAENAGEFLGRLHPLATHFPIALLIAAALAELLLAIRPALGMQTTVRFLVAGGTIGAVAAAFFGWFAGGWRLADRSDTLALHRWTGTGIAGASLVALWLVTRKGESRAGLRILLIALAGALVIQGYLGGEMAFGPNHLGIR